jgi:uncharacterized protein (TIGR03067 family)
MRRTAFGLGVLVLVAGGIARGGDASKKDSEKLQGTWVATSLRLRGKDGPPPPAGSTWVIADDRITVVGGPKKDRYWTYRLDAAARPKEIDITEKKDGKEGEVTRGIYRLEGNFFTLAHSISGPKGPRPVSFDDKDAVVITLKRQKS